jgi:hypothetical protein
MGSKSIRWITIIQPIDLVYDALQRTVKPNMGGLAAAGEELTSGGFCVLGIQVQGQVREEAAHSCARD